MKRIFKPFWSLDIVKTENWLGEMAKRGYILKDINTITKVFTFEKSKSLDLTYKICYEKHQVDKISNSLKKEGWQKSISKGKWLFIFNERNKEEIKGSPSRDILVKKYKITRKIVGFIMTLYCLILLPFFLFLTATGAMLGGDGVDVISFKSKDIPLVLHLFNYDLQTLLFLIFIFGIFIVSKLKKGIKNIIAEDKMFEIEVHIEDIDNLDETNLIKKRKLSWVYSPDRIENWLEDMENKGYNLYKVSSWNAFYFKKGEPRKIKYVLDYPKGDDNTYYEINSEAGWKLKYKSSDIITLCVWSKEYTHIEPEIYSDGKGLLDNAKRALIIYTWAFVPLVGIQTLNISSRITSNYDNILSFSTVIYFILLIEFVLLYKNIVSYYIRTKKKVQDN